MFSNKKIIFIKNNKLFLGLLEFGVQCSRVCFSYKGSGLIEDHEVVNVVHSFREISNVTMLYLI